MLPFFRLILLFAGALLPLCTAQAVSGVTLSSSDSGNSSSAEKTICTIELANSATRRTNAIVSVDLKAGVISDGYSIELQDQDGRAIAGQVSASRSVDGETRRLTFVVPEISAGERPLFKVRRKPDSSAKYRWRKNVGNAAELSHFDRRVIASMAEPFDRSTEERRQSTYKIYHHVYSPDGSRLLTKGPGGLFPHHRGIFYGFNRISCSGQSHDLWHCHNLARQVLTSSPIRQAGEVFGREQLQIDWIGEDGNPIAHEKRKITAFALAKATLIEFESRLSSSGHDIVLDGDPQHAGVQFRAAQQVANNTKSQTYYIRPDGRGEPGDYRNWSSDPDDTETNRSHRNLPWNAMSFVMDDVRYTCCYIVHPDNPRPSMFSERDYGRFGSFFRCSLKSNEELIVRYRFWIQQGAMTVPAISAIAEDFSNPIRANVKYPSN